MPSAGEKKRETKSYPAAEVCSGDGTVTPRMLAVAVVIGTAFAALVMQFTESFVTLLIAVFTGGATLAASSRCASGSSPTGRSSAPVITFLITAAVIYFLVLLPMNRVLARYTKPAEETLAGPSEAELLMEIRDLLRAQQRD